MSDKWIADYSNFKWTNSEQSLFVILNNNTFTLYSVPDVSFNFVASIFQAVQLTISIGSSYVDQFIAVFDSYINL